MITFVWSVCFFMMFVNIKDFITFKSTFQITFYRHRRRRRRRLYYYFRFFFGHSCKQNTDDFTVFISFISFFLYSLYLNVYVVESIYILKYYQQRNILKMVMRWACFLTHFRNYVIYMSTAMSWISITLQQTKKAKAIHNTVFVR